jgi:hypothetical protein
MKKKKQNVQMMTKNKIKKTSKEENAMKQTVKKLNK